ncbi:hypothetical protein ACMFMF_009107 [Clarireedia jacksonii]
MEGKAAIGRWKEIERILHPPTSDQPHSEQLPTTRLLPPLPSSFEDTRDSTPHYRQSLLPTAEAEKARAEAKRCGKKRRLDDAEEEDRQKKKKGRAIATEADCQSPLRGSRNTVAEAATTRRKKRWCRSTSLLYLDQF